MCAFILDRAHQVGFRELEMLRECFHSTMHWGGQPLAQMRRTITTTVIQRKPKPCRIMQTYYHPHITQKIQLIIKITWAHPPTEIKSFYRKIILKKFINYLIPRQWQQFPFQNITNERQSAFKCEILEMVTFCRLSACFASDWKSFIFFTPTHFSLIPLQFDSILRYRYQILASRAPPTGFRYNHEFLERQALILDDFLYKLASTMEDYGDLNTLEPRLIEATGMILQSPGFSAASVLTEFIQEPWLHNKLIIFSSEQYWLELLYTGHVLIACIRCSDIL